MLFNIYIHGLPARQSRKYGYGDDLAILLSKPSWEAVEEGLSEDMNTLSSYLKNWRLKLSADKTVSTMFHLYNKAASREMYIMVDNTRLQYLPFPTYLAEVGHHRQCPMRVWRPNTNCGTHPNQLPQTPAPERRAWSN